jgi:hypothetical protein
LPSENNFENKRVKHLENNQIQRYRNSRLNPAELLEFVDHIAVCDKCRLTALQKNDLENLYNSFTSVAAPPESPRKILNFDRLFSNWNLRSGFAVAVILIAFGGSFYLISRNFNDEKTLLSAVQPENIKKETDSIFIENKQPTANKVIENSAESFSVDHLSKHQKTELPVQTVKKTVPPKAITAAKSTEKPVLRENLRLTVKDIETDESQTLGSEPAEKPLSPTKLKISVKNREISVKIEAEKTADKYEFYVAEIPKLSATLRKTVNRNSWRFSQTKLRKNVDYVLQVTFTDEDGKVRTIKKILSLKK